MDCLEMYTQHGNKLILKQGFQQVAKGGNISDRTFGVLSSYVLHLT